LAGDFDPSPRRKKATFHLKIDAAVPVENIGYIQKSSWQLGLMQQAKQAPDQPNPQQNRNQSH
jgi:hypothetical protein